MAIESTEQKQFIIRKNSNIRSNSRNTPVVPPKINFMNQEEQEIEQEFQELVQIEGKLRVVQNKFNNSQKLFSDYFHYQDDSNKYREVGQNILEKDQTLKPYFLQRLQAEESKRQEQEKLQKLRAVKRQSSLHHHSTPVQENKDQQMIRSDPVIPQYIKQISNQRYNSVNRSAVRISQPVNSIKKINQRHLKQSIDSIPPLQQQQINQYQNLVNNKLIRKPNRMINFNKQNNQKMQQQQIINRV